MQGLPEEFPQGYPLRALSLEAERGMRRAAGGQAKQGQTPFLGQLLQALLLEPGGHKFLGEELVPAIGPLNAAAVVRARCALAATASEPAADAGRDAARRPRPGCDHRRAGAGRRGRRGLWRV